MDVRGVRQGDVIVVRVTEGRAWSFVVFEDGPTFPHPEKAHPDETNYPEALKNARVMRAQSGGRILRFDPDAGWSIFCQGDDGSPMVLGGNHHFYSFGKVSCLILITSVASYRAWRVGERADPASPKDKAVAQMFIIVGNGRQLRPIVFPRTTRPVAMLGLGEQQALSDATRYLTRLFGEPEPLQRSRHLHPDGEVLILYDQTISPEEQSRARESGD